MRDIVTHVRAGVQSQNVVWPPAAPGSAAPARCSIVTLRAFARWQSLIEEVAGSAPNVLQDDPVAVSGDEGIF